MTSFPPGSIRAAVAAVGDDWALMHEPNDAGDRNDSIVAELRDQQVMGHCDHLSSRMRRSSMLRRATFGMTAREARELIA